MNATVKAVEARTTQGGKSYWRVNLGGIGWASTFSSTIGNLAQQHIGQELDVETAKTPDGRFTNLASAKPIAVAPETASAPSRDVLIVREVALKASVDSVQPGQGTVEMILQRAEAFTNWLLAEEEPPAPPEDIPF